MEKRKRIDCQKCNLFQTHQNDLSFQKKNSFLITQKSFLEIILKQIKNLQNNFLPDNKNLKNSKKNLIELKTFLSSLLKEKLNSKKYLQNENISKKINIQKLLFPKIISHNNIINKNNNYNTIYNINYINERNQLKDLCFQAENEIDKIEYEIIRKINIIVELRSSNILEKNNLEIQKEQKKHKQKASNIMKINLKQYKKDLFKSIEEKIKNNTKIKKINEEIELFKKLIKSKKEYILSDNIIFEESSDYSKSLIINDNDSDKNIFIDNINKEVVHKKIYNIIKNKNNSSKKNNYHRHSLDFLCKDNKDKSNLNNINEKINNKIIRSLSNKIKKINFNNFKNNFNFNVNLNFNINNINIINTKSNEDKDNKKEDLNLSYNNNSSIWQ